jgi:hypothetical protein
MAKGVSCIMLQFYFCTFLLTLTKEINFNTCRKYINTEWPNRPQNLQTKTGVLLNHYSFIQCPGVTSICTFSKFSYWRILQDFQSLNSYLATNICPKPLWEQREFSYAKFNNINHNLLYRDTSDLIPYFLQSLEYEEHPNFRK